MWLCNMMKTEQDSKINNVHLYTEGAIKHPFIQHADKRFHQFIYFTGEKEVSCRRCHRVCQSPRLKESDALSCVTLERWFENLTENFSFPRSVDLKHRNHSLLNTTRSHGRR